VYSSTLQQFIHHQVGSNPEPVLLVSHLDVLSIGVRNSCADRHDFLMAVAKRLYRVHAAQLAVGLYHGQPPTSISPKRVHDLGRQSLKLSFSEAYDPSKAGNIEASPVDQADDTRQTTDI